MGYLWIVLATHIRNRNLQKDQDAIEREREAKKTVVRNKFGTMQKKWDENERLVCRRYTVRLEVHSHGIPGIAS